MPVDCRGNTEVSNRVHPCRRLRLLVEEVVLWAAERVAAHLEVRTTVTLAG